MSDTADELVRLRADGVLVLAAERGLISELACAMPECRCPEGRGYFESRRQYARWAPSPDHFPFPARDGGLLAPDNVRLSHYSCNVSEGGKIGGKIGGPISGAAAVASGQIQALGRFQGAINAASGHLARVRDPSKAGKAGGAAAVASGRIFTISTAEGSRRGGKTAGAMAASSGRLDRIRTLESTRKGGLATSHKRWHIDRGIMNLKCKLCVGNQ
jgi:hypothetical protein